jgi:hypothetical protein
MQKCQPPGQIFNACHILVTHVSAPEIFSFITEENVGIYYNFQTFWS